MKLKSVDPNVIVIPDTRVTSSWTSEAMEMFRNSLKESGIVSPIVCIEVDGQLVLVDGLHRQMEAIRTGAKKVDIVVMPGSMTDVYIQNLALNNLRGQIKPSDVARTLKEICDQGVIDTTDLAKRTGFGRDYVEKMIIISRADPGIIEALDEGKIKVGHAFALARIPDPDMQSRILQMQVLYRWTINDLEEVIQQSQAVAEQQAASPAPAAPPQEIKFKCYFCGEEHSANRIRNPNTCDACAGILVGAIQAARRDIAPSEG